MRNREMKFKRKYPNSKFIDYDAEQSKQAWHMGGLLENKSIRFPAFIEKMKKKTVNQVKAMLKSKKAGKDRTLTQIIRASAADLKRRERFRKEIPVKKEPRSLVIDGELITMGSFFPDDYDEKLRKRYRIFFVKRLLKKKGVRVLLMHDMPVARTQLAWIARNAYNRHHSTTLPSITRRFL